MPLLQPRHRPITKDKFALLCPTALEGPLPIQTWTGLSKEWTLLTPGATNAPGQPRAFSTDKAAPITNRHTGTKTQTSVGAATFGYGASHPTATNKGGWIGTPSG